MPEPFKLDASVIDQSRRILVTTTVTASPSAATETIIATLTGSGDDIPVASGVLLIAQAAFTVGTSGVSYQVRLRRTNVSGTVVANSGAVTGGVSAGTLQETTIIGFDTVTTSPIATYVLTLTVGSAAAASTVSSVALVAHPV